MLPSKTLNLNNGVNASKILASSIPLESRFSRSAKTWPPPRPSTSTTSSKMTSNNRRPWLKTPPPCKSSLAFSGFFFFEKTDQSRILFDYFCSFIIHILLKNVGFSRISTRIVAIEGKHADHLTTTRPKWSVLDTLVQASQAKCSKLPKIKDSCSKCPKVNQS